MGRFSSSIDTRRIIATLTIALSTGAILAGGATANVAVSNSGWEWANPIPQGRTLGAIAFSGGVGYAVGAGGTALSTSNAGTSWSGLTTGTAAELEQVQALAPSTIVIGGGRGCVTRISQDAGKLFTRIFNVAESKCPEPVAAFSFISPQSGFLLLKDGSVEYTTDGGETFARRTGVPGTSASSGGGEMEGAVVHFASATSGIAFVNKPSGESAAYATPDGGVSWNPVPLPAGSHIQSLYFFNEQDAYAIGPNTLLRSTNAGASWEAARIAAGNPFRSIACSTPTTCILTVESGNELVETTNGGETDSVTTTSSSLIYGAAYASASQIVAVGASGATVLSADGGATFTPASSDIGGEYSRLRRGPGKMLLAPGADGNIAISSNEGASWRVVATQTSQSLVDAAFGTPTLGYALDDKGGLQRTNDGGTSWQTLNPGTSSPASAVVAFGSRSALLLGPGGVYRSVRGGPFEPVAGRIAANASLADYSIAGSTIYAFGEGNHTLIAANDEGARWRAVKLPLSHAAYKKNGKKVKANPGVAIRSVAFATARRGMLLDTQGGLWLTRNGGGSWSEVLSVGSSVGVQLAFSNANDGFLSLRSYLGGPGYAYVLRTSNGGETWHPQQITAGAIPYGGLVSGTPLDAAALVYGSTSGNTTLKRLLFTTASGGDVKGTAERLSLRTTTKSFSQKQLKAAHGEVRVTGALTGAFGGEAIVVSRRNVAGGPWQQQKVIAGANGGSFATTWHISKSSVFVAQWAGDSGRPGQGSKVLEIAVTGKPAGGEGKGNGKGKGKHTKKK
jgi:photosystem II stability/assembly factor-like uncharacterized protein